MPKTGKQGLTITHIILICGFALVIAVMVILFLFLRPQEQKNMIGGDYVPPENFVVTDENAEEIQAQLDAMQENNSFIISMNGVWTFKNAAAVSRDAIMENAEDNRQNFFITLVLSGEEEPIYESKVISPGQSLKDIKLNRELEPGTYSAIAVHHLLLADGSEETEINMAVDLVVES